MKPIQAASQATGIEQSRAIAEVQAMVVVAQKLPRNTTAALAAIKEACSVKSLANSAFFSYSRGRETVTGPSIKLATELARCWGNFNYGVSELSRDDEAGVSEMIAFAWDVQTNVRSSTTFLVPHKRDKRGGPEQLIDLRDIYENNASNAARRLREMILRALPTWLVEDAKAWCWQTIDKGEGELPMDRRILRSVEAMQRLGVSLDRLEGVHGPTSTWTPLLLSQLHVAFLSIQRGELNAEEAFPIVTASKLAGALGAPAKTDEPPAKIEEKPDVSQNSPANEAADVKKTDHPGGAENLTPPARKDEDTAMDEFIDAKIRMLAKVKTLPDLEAMHGEMVKAVGDWAKLGPWNIARLARRDVIQKAAKEKSAKR